MLVVANIVSVAELRNRFDSALAAQSGFPVTLYIVVNTAAL